MARQESKLIISLVDLASAPARGIAATLRRLNEAQERTTAALGAARGQMIDATAAGFALAQALGRPVAAAIEFESAMADVKKVVDFPAPEGFAEMSAELLDLSRRLPMAATGLARIAAEAGAAGIARDEIVRYTELVAKLGVAFDMTADDVGADMTKIKTALGLSVAQTAALADSFNHLSNAMASKAPQIIDFMKRVGSAGKQYGFTVEQTAAIGSAMISAGAEADVAATSFRNVGKALTRGNQVSKAQASAFSSIGMTSMGVTKAMQKDATGTFRSVIERIRKLPKHLQASTISQIFGDEARAIAPLIDNLDLYDKALKMVAQQASYLGSAQKEYDARAATTENNVQLLKNRFTALGITIGAALLPVVNDAIKSFGPLVDRIARLAEQYPALTRAVVLSVGGFVALRIAAVALKYSMLWMKSGLLAYAITGVRGLGAATAAAAVPFVALGRGLGVIAPSARGAAKASVASAKAMMTQKQAAFQTALAVQDLARKGQVAGTNVAQANAAVRASGRALAQAQGEMKRSSAALKDMGPPAFSAARAFRALGAALRFAFISTGVGAIIAGIAAAGYWIYNNWDGITELFTAFGESFMKTLGEGGPMAQKLAGWLKDIWKSIEDILGPVDESGEKWRAWGTVLGEVVGGGVKDLINSLETVAGWLKDLITLAQDTGAAISNFFSVAKGTGPALPPPAPDGTPRKRAGSYARAAVFMPPAASSIPLPAPMPVSPGIDLEPLPSFGADQARQAADSLETALAGGSGDLSRAGGDVATSIRQAAEALRRAGEDAARAISAARISPPAFAGAPAVNANLGQSMPTAGTPGG
ncbi:MAG: phage tail tape measure protein [Rhizobiales bacterium 17-65-6]|nr:MAG: phage tail tape measure protein [Rhizobiales bacterium 17-65-6]